MAHKGGTLYHRAAISISRSPRVVNLFIAGYLLSLPLIILTVCLHGNTLREFRVYGLPSNTT